MPPDSELIIGLRSDGTVVHVSDPHLHSSLERHFDSTSMGPAFVEAATELCASRMAEISIRRVEVLDGGRPRQATLVRTDAIPLRRSLVRTSELMMRTADVFVGQARSAAVELQLHQQDGMPPALYGDGEKLAWILATLVGNAIRIVRQRPERDDPPLVRLEVSYERNNESFVFVVSDNGPGMPETAARWLFRRDPRTGRAVGIALLMVYDIVVAHGGAIRVESRLGEGTRFIVKISRGSPRHA